jgi:hypothetical protein
MRRNVLVSAALAAVYVVLGTHANADSENFSAVLSGFEEVGALPSVNPGTTEPETFTFPTGAILSTGTGTIQLNLDKTNKSISYTLTYSSFSSSTTIQQAHIHFGKRHVPGGIMVFFCTNLGNGPTDNSGNPALPDYSSCNSDRNVDSSKRGGSHVSKHTSDGFRWARRGPRIEYCLWKYPHHAVPIR